jgi:hypothetical protein
VRGLSGLSRADSADETRNPGAPQAFYFGTYGAPGHHLRDEYGRKVRPTHPHEGVEAIQWGPLPWKHIDGGLCPRGPQRQGEALLHHKDGWTALAFWNRTDDTRAGSNSAFFFEGTLTFEEALAAARERFPRVMRHLPFEVRPVSEHPSSPAASTEGRSCNPRSADIPGSGEAESQ